MFVTFQGDTDLWAECRVGACCFQPDSVETESSVPLGCLWEGEGMADKPQFPPQAAEKCLCFSRYARVPTEPRGRSCLL